MVESVEKILLQINKDSDDNLKFVLNETSEIELRALSSLLKDLDKAISELLEVDLVDLD